MSAQLEQIEEQARALSAVDAAWEEEIEHRVESFDRGLMPTHQADSVFAEVRKILE